MEQDTIGYQPSVHQTKLRRLDLNDHQHARIKYKITQAAAAWAAAACIYRVCTIGSFGTGDQPGHAALI